MTADAVAADLSDAQKRRLRQLLGDLIISVLRRHRALRYFQGFHDIVSVFLLSLTDWERLGEEGADIGEDDLELLRQCVARLSLHRIRDSMTSTMEPVMGYLRSVLGSYMRPCGS